jgi:hypothetical protein
LDLADKEIIGCIDSSITAPVANFVTPAAKVRVAHVSAPQLLRRDMIASLIAGHPARPVVL